MISATEDRRRETVVDLIDEKSRKDLFPVGRLDIDTEGLLLITNDGALAHRLLHRDITWIRCMRRDARDFVPDEAVDKFREGITLGRTFLYACGAGDLREETGGSGDRDGGGESW